MKKGVECLSKLVHERIESLRADEDNNRVEVSVKRAGDSVVKCPVAVLQERRSKTTDVWGAFQAARKTHEDLTIPMKKMVSESR